MIGRLHIWERWGIFWIGKNSRLEYFPQLINDIECFYRGRKKNNVWHKNLNLKILINCLVLNTYFKNIEKNKKL